MDKKNIKSNWDKIKFNLIQNHQILKNEELILTEGKEEILFNNIQNKLNISREELIYLFYLYTINN